jgi:hypothetical protein
MDQYKVVATLASHMVIASSDKSGGQKDGDKKLKERQGKQGGGGKPPQNVTVNAVTQ